MRAEGAVGPTGRDLLGLKPRDFAVERVRRGHIRKGILSRCRIVVHISGAVEERRQGLTGNGIMRAEGAIRPAGRDVLLVHPHDLLVEGIARSNVGERRLLGQNNIG